MIRECTAEDFDEIVNLVNDAAMAYKGVIPDDRWRQPYMTKEELRLQIEDGVKFSCYVNQHEIIGVMGIQDKSDVELIRHAYVKTSQRNRGVGTLLLNAFMKHSRKPILIGTWKAAYWAIGFYQKNGFCLVDEAEKNRLLRKYWRIPDRQ